MEQLKQQLKAFVQKEISMAELEDDLLRCLKENQANADAIQQVIANLGSRGILGKEDIQHLTKIVLDWQAPSAEEDANVDYTVGFQELLKQYLNRRISLETVKSGLRYDLSEDTDNIVRYDKVLSALAKKGSTLPVEEINELLDVIDKVNDSLPDAPVEDEDGGDEKTVFFKRDKPSEVDEELLEKTVFKKQKRDSSRRRDRTSRTGKTSITGTGTASGTDTRWAKPFEKDEEIQVGVGSLLRNGRYRLTEFIGYGGMGDVYKAEDTLSVEAGDFEHKDYAVKVLNKEFRDHPESLKTLQRETRKTANLSHEHVVNVFSIDRDEQSVFMVMELMRGEDLRDILKKNPTGLPKEKAIRYILEMSDALRYAHTQDIIHSDFKPGNVFIDNDSVKVIDFGIARAADDGKEKTDTFDAGDLGALTPSYASLEMLIDGDNPDPKDDIYALGCLSYELLTGRHPFMEDRKKIPADKAKEKGMTPAQIPGLKSWQWKAIRGCLEFEREDRLGDLVQFIHDMKMEKRPLSLKLVAGSAAAVISVVAGSYGLLGYMDQRELIQLENLIKSGDHSQILDRFDVLKNKYEDNEDRLEEVFNEDSTLPYLLERVEQLIADDNFEQAKPAMQVAQLEYPRDVDVRDLDVKMQGEKAKRTNELDTQIKELLKVSTFDERYKELEKLWSKSKRVDKDTPKEAAVVVVVNRLRDAAQELERTSSFDKAAELVTFSIQLFQSDERELEYGELLALQDSLQRRRGEQANQEKIAALVNSLGSFDGNSSIEELIESVQKISELSELDSGNSILQKYKDSLDKLLNKEVTDIVARRDWSDAVVTIDKFESILSATEISKLRDQVSLARTGYDDTLTDLSRKIGNAARSSKPGEAIPLLEELKYLGVPDTTLQSAQNQIALGWLQQAKIQTNQDNYDEASGFINQALGIAKASETIRQLQEQRSTIEQLKIDSVSQVASQRVEERQQLREKQIASLEERVSSEINTTELNSGAVGNVISLLNQLEVLDVNNPVLETAKNRLSERYLSQSQTLVGSGNLDGAIELIRDSIRVLPSKQALVDRREELQVLVKQQLAAQEAKQSTEMEGDIRSLVSDFEPSRDSSRLTRMLNDYELLVSGQNVFSRDIRFQAADGWIEEAENLTGNNRFDEAEAAINRARSFDQNHGRIDGLVNLVAGDRVTYQKEKSEADRKAELNALTEGFVTQIRALDVDAAEKTLVELEKYNLPNTDDFFQVTVPEEYLALADRTASEDVDQAIEYIEKGLSYNKDFEKLQEGLVKFNLHQQIVQLMSDNPEQATALLAQARVKYEKDPLFVLLVIPTVNSGEKPPGSTSAVVNSPVNAAAKECMPSFAGRGLRNRNTCYDIVEGEVKGPRLVVVDSSSGPYAIMRYELRVVEYNDFCSTNSSCTTLSMDGDLPVTGLGAADISNYAQWLSGKSGKEYRIPTLQEWQHAAVAGGVNQADRNCVALGGRGQKMELYDFMKGKGLNGWGLAHTVGNAQELVLDGSEYKVAGGAYINNNIDCKPITVSSSDGSPNEFTGFRLIRNM
ncbi:MAG: serine/threonine protein kinase [Candidatus Azotimanducaceae bacterium]|jgi:serine/threonine protein kinase